MADSLLSLNDNNDTNAREEIINKWKDKPQTELLAAKAESDLYIKTLTARLDDLKNDYLQLRDQHQASEDLKKMIEKLEASRSGTDTTPAIPTGTDVVPTAIKPEDIEKMIASKMSEAELQRKRQTNFNTVESKLKEQFGENYANVLKQRSDALGLSQEFVDDLARNHPSVFFKTFELDTPVRQETFQTPPRTNQRPVSFAPQVNKRDWNYYQNLKKENPRLYLDPKIAIQMHDDAIALGSAFGMPED